jgi:hypothetical protein
VVAAAQGVPANVVAIWSQSGDLTRASGRVTGPLTSVFGGAPRGIRTPNRQIRSQPSPVPAPPSGPFVSPPVLVNSHVAGPTRASVPDRHARLGRNVVAVSGRRRQTGRLVTGRLLGHAEAEHQIQDLVLYPSKDENPPPALLKSRPSRPSAL